MHLTTFLTLMLKSTGAVKHPRLLGLFCGGLLLALTMPATAQSVNSMCWYTQGQAGTVTFNSGTTNTGSTGNSINLAPGTPINTVLWTSNTAAVPNPPTMQCNSNAVPSGIANSIAGPPTSGNTLFPTNIPGISYKLLHPDASTLLASYPNYPITNGQNGTQFSVATNVQLVYTGPYLPPAGTYNITGPLSQWNVDTCNGTGVQIGRNWYCYNTGNFNSPVSAQPVEYFNISVTISVVVPTCNVDPGSVNKIVTLPGVTTAQLAVNPTPGSTPFSLQLVNCPTGQKVFININTASPFAGGTGVIAPTTGAGYATNVGVQILQADGTTPVTFGDAPAQAINSGTTSGSSYAINLYARYYRTGTPTAGSVKGVATYTINYQ